MMKEKICLMGILVSCLDNFFRVTNKKLYKILKGCECILQFFLSKDYRLHWAITHLAFPRALAGLGLLIHMAKANLSIINHNTTYKGKYKYFEQFWFFLNVFTNERI